jgi:hypothetical protein
MLTGWPATGAGRESQAVIRNKASKESNHRAAVTQIHALGFLTLNLAQ